MPPKVSQLKDGQWATNFVQFYFLNMGCMLKISHINMAITKNKEITRKEYFRYHVVDVTIFQYSTWTF